MFKPFSLICTMLLTDIWFQNGVKMVSSKLPIKLFTEMTETNRPYTSVVNTTRLVIESTNQTVSSEGEYRFLDFTINHVAQSFSGSSSNHIMKIDPIFGIIQLTVPFDRELLCPDSQSTNIQCSLNFLIVWRAKKSINVQSHDHMIYIDLTVVVIDINDNVPKFPSDASVQRFNIDEECDIGTGISLPSAIDIDSLENGITMYQFHPTATSVDVLRHFKILNLRGTDMSCGSDIKLGLTSISEVRSQPISPCLQVTSRIDREQVKKFAFRIIALDNDQNKAEMDMELSVNDVNDHKPVWPATLTYFDSGGFPHVSHGSTSEQTNQTVTTYSIPVKVCTTQRKLLHLNAQDADEGINRLVSYQLDGTLRAKRFQLVNNYLLLNEMSLKGIQKDRLELSVWAMDGGGLTSPARILLHLEDCNNHRPSIIINPTVFAIPENISGFTQLITLITVRDMDNIRSANSEFECHLNETTYLNLEMVADGPSVDGQLESMDEIHVGRWKIYNLNTVPHIPFDRELHERYTILLRCADNGAPGLSSEQIITILVGDINDNHPSFVALNRTASGRQNDKKGMRSFHFDIPEDAARGTHVGQLAAIDMDVGENARLEFASGEDIRNGSVFRVDINGDLILVDKLDRETQDRYVMKVIVKDFGQPVSLSDTAVVTIVVLDVNDCPPKFEQEYVFEVVESYGSMPIHQYLGYVKATDLDLGLNGTVTYRLASASSHAGIRDHVEAGLINVTPEGKLTIHGVLDRELTPVLLVDIIAQDSGTPNRLTSQTTLTIHALDLNDNKPRFVEPFIYQSSTSASGHVNSTATNTFRNLNLSLDAAVGSELMQFKAIDPDASVNGTVEFALITPDGTASIDFAGLRTTPTFSLRSDGVLTLSDSLSYDRVHSFKSSQSLIRHRRPDRLLIKAFDKGPHQQLTVTVVHVTYFDPFQATTTFSGSADNQPIRIKGWSSDLKITKRAIQNDPGKNKLPVFYLLALAICFALLLIICTLVYIYLKSQKITQSEKLHAGNSNEHITEYVQAAHQDVPGCYTIDEWKSIEDVAHTFDAKSTGYQSARRLPYEVILCRQPDCKKTLIDSVAAAECSQGHIELPTMSCCTFPQNRCHGNKSHRKPRSNEYEDVCQRNIDREFGMNNDQNEHKEDVLAQAKQIIPLGCNEGKRIGSFV